LVANGTWMLCFDKLDLVNGLSEPRFLRKIATVEFSALVDLSRVPSLSAEDFRRLLQQTEAMRIARAGVRD